MTPGHWVCTDWPVPGTKWKKFFPADNHLLQVEPGKEISELLRYVPSSGTATSGLTWDPQVVWWGDPKGDMRLDDAGSLVYDSPLLKEAFEIGGLPKVHLRVSADAPLAHWVARLEDVQPDGTVALVTGANINGSQRDSRLEPSPLVAGEVYDMELEMHFTTWTFKPGHRVRLAVSNAVFPMIWPTPYPMITKLFMGARGTRLELPVIPEMEPRVPSFVPPEPRPQSATAQTQPPQSKEEGLADAYFWPAESVEMRRSMDATVSVDWKGARSSESPGRHQHSYLRDYFVTNDKNPANSSYRGERGRWLEIGGRRIELQTTIDVRSDSTNFYVVFLRRFFENGKQIREREWKETVKRDFQ
jgi:hypothetical protein